MENADSPNVWTYTIQNLERYAPNGMPYIYTVTEEAVTGYNQKTGTVSGTAPASGDLTLSALENNLGKSYTVRKNWMDGNNKYGLRPSSITVVLQRSIDGTNWENILWESGFGSYNATTKKWTGLPSVTTDEAGQPIVSIQLTADYVIPNTRYNSWQYTFTNLPEKDTDENTWQYRCIETEIAGVKLYVSCEYPWDVRQAGAYTRSYPAWSDEKAVIQNKLESTSLYVEVNWDKDQDNLYHSRPQSLTLKLQKRGFRVNENG